MRIKTPNHVEAHIPFRLDMLLCEKERRKLSETLINKPSEALGEVARFEEICHHSARIAHGRFFSGTLEYRDRDGQDQNIDAGVFCRAEFPGIMLAWGNIGPEGCEMSEFLLTTGFTLALWKPKGKKARPAHLLIRRGMVEFHIGISDQVPALADALNQADEDRATMEIVNPIALRVAECHMLDE